MIINIIGSMRTGTQILVVLGMIYSTSIDAVSGVRMVITDQAGNLLSQVQVRQPFVCAVVVEGVGSGTYHPQVQGIEPFLAQPRPDITRNDAQQTITYSYRLRIDEVGEYTFGPAQVHDGVKNYTSDEVTVLVDTSMIIADDGLPSKNKSKKRKPWAEFRTSATEIYVGQPLVCTVSYYAPKGDTYTFQTMYPSVPDGFEKSKQQGIEPIEEKFDGERYAGMQGQWVLYPQAPGKYMIPGCRVDYLVTEQENRKTNGYGRWTFFSSIITRQDTLHSNAVHVTVKSVPQYTKEDVAATVIGTISHFDVSIDTPTIALGDGAHITVDIQGDRGLERMEHFTFHGVSDALRMYESHAANTAARTPQDPWKKKFEFVVQGVKPGTVTIPAQAIACFNVQKGTYALVRSKPITITITGELPTAQPEKNDDTSAPSEGQEAHEKLPIPLAPLTTMGWHDSVPAPYPWHLFWWLFSVPIGLAVVWLIAASLRRRVMRNASYWVTKTAWCRARWRTMRAVRSNNGAALYHIVLGYIANKKGVSEHMVNEHYARTVVHAVLHDHVVMAQWDGLVRDLATKAFSGHSHEESCHDLGVRVIEWINRLEAVL